MSLKQCVHRILNRKNKITFKMGYCGFVHLYAMLWITLGTPGKCVPLYIRLYGKHHFSCLLLLFCGLVDDI